MRRFANQILSKTHWILSGPMQAGELASGGGENKLPGSKQKSKKESPLLRSCSWNPDKIMKCQVNSSANCIVMIPHCFPATDMEWSTRKAVFQFIMRAWCAGQTKCLENVQLPHFNSQAPKRLRAMPTSRQDGQGVRNQIPCTKVKAWICSAGPDPKCWLRLLPDLNPDLLIS